MTNVWSTTSTSSTRMSGRGNNVLVGINEGTTVAGPGGIAVANLSMQKRRAARAPFSRLSDGKRHPVTVRYAR